MNPILRYGLADGDGLEQGDLLRDCPTFRPTAANEFEEISSEVVILSQSCDLTNDKLEIVQVCPIFSLDELAAEADRFRSKRGREDLRRGHFPGFHLLNLCEIPGHESDFWSATSARCSAFMWLSRKLWLSNSHRECDFFRRIENTWLKPLPDSSCESGSPLMCRRLPEITFGKIE